MTTTKPTTVPARVTWFRMFWMIMIGDAALTPYLRCWRGDSPYSALYRTGLSAFILFPVIPPIISFGLNWPSVFGVGKGLHFACWIIGVSLLVAWMVITAMNTVALFKTVSAFRMVWNAGTIDLLAVRDYLAIDVKKIVGPAVREAGMILACERLTATVGQFSNLIPRRNAGRSFIKTSKETARMAIWQRQVAKRNMSRYLEACVWFNPHLKHSVLTGTTFSLAKTE